MICDIHFDIPQSITWSIHRRTSRCLHVVQNALEIAQKDQEVRSMVENDVGEIKGSFGVSGG